jgi:hypothetical protein
MARRDHRQIRYCLTIQARLALDLGDYDLLSEALRSLVDDVGNRRADDTAFDFDFLDRIDESRIDANLLRQYRALATVRI